VEGHTHAYIPTSQKGSAGGVAELDGSGKVPAGQLPSYVDDVLEVANYAALPGTGVTGIIYVTLDTNLCYRWTGSVYAEISPSLALGETSASAYRGDRGKAAYDHSQTTHDKAYVGLGNVDNTSDANKPISSATQNALNAKAPTSNPTFTGKVENQVTHAINQGGETRIGSYYEGNFNGIGFCYWIDGVGSTHRYVSVYVGGLRTDIITLSDSGIVVGGSVKGTSLKTANWSIEEDVNGNELHKYQGVLKYWVTPDGVINSVNNIRGRVTP
jgi:hypothetical protein